MGETAATFQGRSYLKFEELQVFDPGSKRAQSSFVASMGYHGGGRKEGTAGWVVGVEGVRELKVAPWVVQERKKMLFCSLIGFLSSTKGGLVKVEQWLERCWGKMLVQVQLLNEEVVWIQFVSEEEVEEVLGKAKDQRFQLPFSLLKRWMEVLGPPP